MPFWVSSLISGLVMAASTLVGKVLIALGFGYATYSGFDYLMQTTLDKIMGLLGDFSSSPMAAWAGFLMLDKHISLGLSAISVKVLLNGLSDGKKFLTRK